MEFKKKTLETQIIEIFQKISPAITRLIQSATNNDKIVLNLGKTKSKNKNEININPSILVNSVSDSDLEFKEVIIGTVIHEAIHSMEDYKFNIEKDLLKFKDETDGLTDIDEVLEVLSGPFGKYIFEILVHSYEEVKFVDNFKGLKSILEDIYTESSINIKNLKPFNTFLTLMFHNIAGYIEVDFQTYPKNIKESIKETLAILSNFSYDRDLI